MARAEWDFYETLRAEVQALKTHVNIGGPIFEPCVGRWAIAQHFDDRQVWTNDLNPERNADTHLDACTLVVPVGPEWVVTNPPFIVAFPILKNLHRQHIDIAMYLRVTFIEPTRKPEEKGGRGQWLSNHPPNDMIVLPRKSYSGNGRTDSATRAWFVWRKDPHLHPQRIIVVPPNYHLTDKG